MRPTYFGWYHSKQKNNNQNIHLFCLFQYHDMVHSNSISSLLCKQMTKCLQLNVSAEKNWFRWLGKISSNLQYEWTYVRFLEGGGGQVWMCTGLVRKRGSKFNGGRGDIRKSHFWRRSAWQLVWGHKARTMSILPSYLWVWLRVDCLNT